MIGIIPFNSKNYIKYMEIDNVPPSHPKKTRKIKEIKEGHDEVMDCD